MESKALLRLEDCVEQLVERLDKVYERQSQLGAALVKSREELDDVKRELEHFRSERSETREKVDSLLKRFESLDVDWERTGS